jgi:Ser/Thr protein kinase RdoA (MazF antagonist)
MNHEQSHYYQHLTPEVVLNAVEQQGFTPSGHLLALNSYENRVYQIGLEDNGFVIGKFYRQPRWSDAAILEEHQFSLELAAAEIPVIAPLKDDQQQTLFHFEGFRFALYPRCGGHRPELEQADSLEQIGRLLGRLHAIGREKPFQHRPELTVERFGRQAILNLRDSSLVPPEAEHNFFTAAETLLGAIEQQMQALGRFPFQRLHGDFHAGNLLQNPEGLFVVDLDDCLMGPVVQDLWLLLDGDVEVMKRQLDPLLRGYEMFNHFDISQFSLVECLRGLRLLHYNAWIAKRWDDPAFPLHFSWFSSPRHWEEQIIDLRQQLERVQNPPLLY